MNIWSCYLGSLDCWVHFCTLPHNDIYNNTKFLQVECCKFALFPMIKKELKDIKGHKKTHCIWKSLQSTNESKPADRPEIHCSIKENSSEYLHEFNYDDFGLVNEECCADERNTYCVCSNKFYELALILTKKNGLFEADSPEKVWLLLQKFYPLIWKIWDIFFTNHIHPFLFSLSHR